MDLAIVGSKESIWSTFGLLKICYYPLLFSGIDFVEKNIIRETARRCVQNYENTVRLLRYNHHICYVSNKKAVF